MPVTDENNRINLIPAAQEVTWGKGSFPLKELGAVCCLTPVLQKKAVLLADYLRDGTDHELILCDSIPEKAFFISIKLEGTPASQEMGFPDESYRLNIGDKAISLTAPHPAGIARAIQTLRQLAAQGDMLPALSIIDSPRFPWRGMHLDVARHFFPKKDILRFIDTIALFRFNRLHLHLTDDQGWRPEIKKYPGLTETGAYRKSTQIGHFREKPHRYDDVRYGGFYTQDDMREMVEYARLREIEIIPEIDMPGHMQAAIAAYPELGCTDMTIETRCQWGISQHILNPEKKTIEFMKDVLDEIMDIFPSPFIHIGGDEAHKYEWEEQRRVQERMAALGLKSEEELQSWFIGQMGEHLRLRGRKMIGWDEILEGGLTEGAIVMSWRGEAGGIEAARKGAHVLNCTNSHTYFDYFQGPADSEPLAIGGDLPLEKVYEFDPVPKAIRDSRKHLVLGSQGQLWTEYMGDFRQVEYMAFPRALALAECLWCRPEEKDWTSFEKRLHTGESLLEDMGVNYRKR